MKARLLGFTLIEILIVIVILGVLSSLISGNFINSLKKGNDTKRKTDLDQVRKALELFYEDSGTYPSFTGNKIPANESFCLNDDCGAGSKVYMQKLPSDTKSGCFYAYYTDAKTYYKIYSFIENPDDNGGGVKQAGYGVSCCSDGTKCKYGISSPNLGPSEL